MEKKGSKKIFIAAFIIVICMPVAVWPFIGGFFDRANYENRNTASKPELSIETIDTYPRDYEKYFNDTLPFRNQLIRLNSRVDYYLFHQSSSPKVIIGKDQWLFYQDVYDGDPIACYQGTNLYTEEELEAIAQNMIRTRDYLAERNIEFVIFIAPNKERVYSEMMPDCYGEPANNYAALQVYRYIRENTNLRIVYAYDALMEAKDKAGDTLLYYKNDTHWNQVGGYVGSRELLKELGIEIPDITSDSIRIEETENGGNDLSNMLNLEADLAGNDKGYLISGYNTHQAEYEKWDSTEIIYHAVGADGRKLFVYRDSFCTAMAEYLGSQFNESYMVHKNEYRNSLLEEQDPDIFVYEVVERSVGGMEWFDIHKQGEEGPA